MLYPARKLDSAWTGKVPTHMQLPGAPAGNIQALKHSLGDKVILSRAARERSSVLLFTSKTLGPLAMLSSFPHVLLSGAYGLTSFLIHFSVGAVVSLPWLINKLRPKPMEMPLPAAAPSAPAPAPTAAPPRPAERPKTPAAASNDLGLPGFEFGGPEEPKTAEQPANDLGLPGFEFGGPEESKTAEQPANDLGLPGFDFTEEKTAEPTNELGLPGFDFTEEKPPTEPPANNLGLPGFDLPDETTAPSSPPQPANELGLPGFDLPDDLNGGKS